MRLPCRFLLLLHLTPLTPPRSHLDNICSSHQRTGHPETPQTGTRKGADSHSAIQANQSAPQSHALPHPSFSIKFSQCEMFLFSFFRYSSQRFTLLAFKSLSVSMLCRSATSLPASLRRGDAVGTGLTLCFLARRFSAATLAAG